MKESPLQMRDMLLGLRDPLARIELALGRLVEDPGPTSPGLVAAIRGAIGDADARLEGALRALGGGSSGPEPLGDCRPALVQVAQRVRGALAARGCSLRVQASPEPVIGEPARMRRAALCMLRAASPWSGSEGSIRIGLVAGPADCGLRLHAVRGRRGRGLAADPLARFAFAEGARLEIDPDAQGGLEIELRVPRRSDP